MCCASRPRKNREFRRKAERQRQDETPAKAGVFAFDGKRTANRSAARTDSIVKQPSEIVRGMFRDAAASSALALTNVRERSAGRRILVFHAWRRACAAHRGKACTHLAMRPPPGAPPAAAFAGVPRMGVRHQPRAAFLEPAFSPANAASSSQGAHSGARAESQGRPSAGLRDLPAGAAPRSVIQASLEDALDERGTRTIRPVRGCGDKFFNSLEDSIGEDE
jgi:hypothetical protein